MVPDRRVLDASLEHSLLRVLAAVFLVLPDQAPDLFDPIDELSELLEVIQENLPEDADVPRGCLRLVVFRERLPRLSTLTLWHVRQPPLGLSTRVQTEHAVQLPAPHRLGRCEVHVPHVVGSRTGQLHQYAVWARLPLRRTA